MRVRALRWVALGVLIVLLVVAGSHFASRGDSPSGYRVRALFDNASFVVNGEDVRVGGVIAGKISGVELNAQNKAVVVLDITDPAFQDFRQDATCRVGLQSLIGEQFIDCNPTQQRGEGVTPAPPLKAIATGPNRGQRVLPVSQTSSPVGPDLLANIMRVPERQRLQIIISELGTGLAGNGAELREVVQRANPTLQQANRLVSILATQNKTISSLVQQSDQALGPLAERRGDLARFVASSGRVAQAAADRGDDLERDFADFPAFLRQLKPAVQRIGRLSDQIGPSVANLTAQAPALNSAVTQLAPFVDAATPALKSLGLTADQGRKTFPKLDALAKQLNATATPLAPLAKSLADLGGSFDRTGGVADILHLLYYYTGSLNGKDAISHTQRSTVYASTCITRLAQQNGQCAAQFDHGSTGAAGAADSRGVPSSAAATSKVASPKATAKRMRSKPVADPDVARARGALESLLGPNGTR